MKQQTLQEPPLIALILNSEDLNLLIDLTQDHLDFNKCFSATPDEPDDTRTDEQRTKARFEAMEEANKAKKTLEKLRKALETLK
jgi:hypothetical protein